MRPGVSRVHISMGTPGWNVYYLWGLGVVFGKCSSLPTQKSERMLQTNFLLVFSLLPTSQPFLLICSNIWEQSRLSQCCWSPPQLYLMWTRLLGVNAVADKEGPAPGFYLKEHGCIPRQLLSTPTSHKEERTPEASQAPKEPSIVSWELLSSFPGDLCGISSRQGWTFQARHWSQAFIRWAPFLSEFVSSAFLLLRWGCYFLYDCLENETKWQISSCMALPLAHGVNLINISLPLPMITLHMSEFTVEFEDIGCVLQQGSMQLQYRLTSIC